MSFSEKKIQILGDARGRVKMDMERRVKAGTAYVGYFEGCLFLDDQQSVHDVISDSDGPYESKATAHSILKDCRANCRN